MNRLLGKIGEKMVEGVFFSSVSHFIQKIFTRAIGFIFKKINQILCCLDRIFGFAASFILCKTTKVENKVMLLTFQGDYTCNPKGIVEEMVRQGTDYPIIWAVNQEILRSVYPLNVHLVRKNSFEYYKQLVSSRVVIENTNILERQRVFKNRGQYWLQTWHGSLGIKRLDGDIVMNQQWKKIAKKSRKHIDYLLSNSKFESWVFRTSYWKGVPALLTGHARNDIFFLEDPQRIAQIRKRVSRFLGLRPDKKIFLFAPTHRDDVSEQFYELDYSLIREALGDRFGGDWQIVIRLHNRLRRRHIASRKELPEYVSDATGYDDMQELLFCTDVGLTDFSSWIFDYMLTRRPGFIIKLDLEQFEEQRGFYYPIESTPFPIAGDSRELAQNIREFDEHTYRRGVNRFLKAKGCMEDGHAGERIVRKINEWMK